MEALQAKLRCDEDAEDLTSPLPRDPSMNKGQLRQYTLDDSPEYPLFDTAPVVYNPNAVRVYAQSPVSSLQRYPQPGIAQPHLTNSSPVPVPVPTRSNPAHNPLSLLSPLLPRKNALATRSKRSSPQVPMILKRRDPPRSTSEHPSKMLKTEPGTFRGSSDASDIPDDAEMLLLSLAKDSPTRPDSSSLSKPLPSSSSLSSPRRRAANSTSVSTSQHHRTIGKDSSSSHLQLSPLRRSGNGVSMISTNTSASLNSSPSSKSKSKLKEGGGGGVGVGVGVGDIETDVGSNSNSNDKRAKQFDQLENDIASILKWLTIVIDKHREIEVLKNDAKVLGRCQKKVKVKKFNQFLERVIKVNRDELEMLAKMQQAVVDLDGMLLGWKHGDSSR